MGLCRIIQDPSQPVILYELLPPRVGVAGELESHLALVRHLRDNVDAINIPEVRLESRQGDQRKRLPERIEPRAFGRAIQAATATEAIVNRITVHEDRRVQQSWMRETFHEYGLRTLVLVGGESPDIVYPGPGVLEAASLASEEGLEFLLGGITIPGRPEETERVRQKSERGIGFFTSQVLLDSAEVIRLLCGLDGLEVRIFLSFCPLSSLRDLEFLRWLGVEVPDKVSQRIAEAENRQAAVAQSIALAESVLTDVFDNLPPTAPALGLHVEPITRWNVGPSQEMLLRLGETYRTLLQARLPPAGPRKTAVLPEGR